MCPEPSLPSASEMGASASPLRVNVGARALGSLVGRDPGWSGPTPSRE